MKKIKWGRISVLIVLVVSVISIQAVATSASKVATLVYNNIKISLDGQAITPTDANGTEVEPFIIDGTTYLPVRAIGDALGLDVNWDSETSTVLLSTPNTVNGTLVYEDEYVDIYFTGCEYKSDYSEKYSAVFNVKNKTEYELTFQCDALAFNGTSYNGLGGSDAVAPNSSGEVKFYTTDQELPLSGITKISGTISVIDFSYELLEKSYDAKFADITA